MWPPFWQKRKLMEEIKELKDKLKIILEDYKTELKTNQEENVPVDFDGFII